MLQYAKLSITIIIILILGSIYYKYHSKPLKDLRNNNSELENKINSITLEKDNIMVDLQKCKSDTKVNTFETYFKGYSDANSTINNSLTF
jgi:uncharacterized protein YoxC